MRRSARADSGSNQAMAVAAKRINLAGRDFVDRSAGQHSAIAGTTLQGQRIVPYTPFRPLRPRYQAVPGHFEPAHWLTRHEQPKPLLWVELIEQEQLLAATGLDQDGDVSRTRVLDRDDAEFDRFGTDVELQYRPVLHQTGAAILPTNHRRRLRTSDQFGARHNGIPSGKAAEHDTKRVA